MLTLEDLKELKPQFEAIHQHLNVALIKSGADIPDDAVENYATSLNLMQELIDEVNQKEGYSTKDAFINFLGPSSKKWKGTVEGLNAAMKSRYFMRGVTNLSAEDIKELKPRFERIHWFLNIASIKRGADMTEDAAGDYIMSIVLTEGLADEVIQKQLESDKGTFSRAFTPSAGKAGAAGGATAAIASLSFTGLGGFGIAAGGTAVGVAGLTGATIATGGTALAGGAALYLAYKGVSMAYETETGQKVAEQVATTGQNAVEQATTTGKKSVDQARTLGKRGINRMRNLRKRFGSDEN